MTDKMEFLQDIVARTCMKIDETEKCKEIFVEHGENAEEAMDEIEEELDSEIREKAKEAVEELNGELEE